MSPQDQLRFPLLEEVVGLLDRIPNPCAILDSNLTILYANQACSLWLVGALRSLNGRSFRGIVPAWSSSDLESWVSGLAHSGTAGERVFVDARSGKAYQIQLAPTSAGIQLIATPWQLPSSAVISRDDRLSRNDDSGGRGPETIEGPEETDSELRQMKSELEETQSRLQMAVDAARLGVWVRYLPGSAYQTNRHGRAHFGIFDDREVTPALYESCLSTEDVPLVYGVLDDLFPIESRRDSIHRVIGVDGRTRWIRAYGSITRDETGQPMIFQGVTVDITDQLAREAELERKVNERTLELHAALRESEAFSYTVSHDLRSPLRSIIATSRLLEEDYAPELSPGARQLLDRQADSALRLADVIDALLAMSRIGRQAMVRVPMDISALAMSVAKELAPRNPEVQVHVAPGLQANADPQLLRLVFQNLIENAMKFSPQGGMIEVGRTVHEVDQTFFVKDRGVGFDMGFADKLFQPFQRLHLESEFPGTGIGLANVRRIVERHNGRIWAESELGKGSTFLFTLA